MFVEQREYIEYMCRSSAYFFNVNFVQRHRNNEKYGLHSVNVYTLCIIMTESIPVVAMMRLTVRPAARFVTSNYCRRRSHLSKSVHRILRKYGSQCDSGMASVDCISE